MAILIVKMFLTILDCNQLQTSTTQAMISVGKQLDDKLEPPELLSQTHNSNLFL